MEREKKKKKRTHNYSPHLPLRPGHVSVHRRQGPDVSLVDSARERGVPRGGAPGRATAGGGGFRGRGGGGGGGDAVLKVDVGAPDLVAGLPLGPALEDAPGIVEVLELKIVESEKSEFAFLS